MIASTDFIHDHAETAFITNYNAATHEITLDRPLNYTHYSATQQFGL